ncbi:MAG: zinc ribbon domain-containing protein [Erysipelotrichaceae bacterium]|nr:zinc ribbon domain-containing protein [Erysipelotrichaceae bacterium]
MKICRQCGAEVSDDSLYCKNCGAKQEEITQNQLFVKIKNYYNHINNYLTTKNIQKKHVLLIGIMIIASLAMITVYTNTLTAKEKYAMQMVERYQDMLKDPDSMILRSDVIIIDGYNYDDEYHTYCFFVASGTNSFGASVQSLVSFRDNTFFDDVNDDLDYSDFDSWNEYMNYLDTKLVYLDYKIYGENMCDSVDDYNYISCDIVDSKVVGKKLNISFTE